MRMVELFHERVRRAFWEWSGQSRRAKPRDLTIFSTDHEWTYDVKDSASKSRNSPFDGRSFKGAPMATVVAGRVVWKR